MDIDYDKSNPQGVARDTGGDELGRTLLFIALAAFAVTAAVVPALAQSEQGCKGIVKAVKQQSVNNPEKVNDNLFEKIDERNCFDEDPKEV